VNGVVRQDEMNAKKLGIALAIGWLGLPFVACAGAFVAWRSDTEFSFGSKVFSALIFLPLILGTAMFVSFAVLRLRSARATKLIFASVSLLLVFTTICAAIGFNTVPRRFSPETTLTAPFDRYFEYAPQNAFGFPFPHYRVFDRENPDGDYVIGKTLFDFTSLLGNVTFWTLPVYILTAITFTILPKQGEQSIGPKCSIDAP
jgi:hypothetical protein